MKKVGDYFEIQYQNGHALCEKHKYDPNGPELETLVYHVLDVNTGHPDEGGGLMYCEVHDVNGNLFITGWFPNMA